MKHRILFLDVDGVLNSMPFIYESEKRWKSDDPMRFAQDIDPEAVALLNEVVEATGCKIVISSSWRHAHSPDRMQAYLDSRGFSGEVIDETPYYVSRLDESSRSLFGIDCDPDVTRKYGPRSSEIALWLRENDGWVSSFAIVDDSADAGFGIAERFVKTNMHVGLTRDDVSALIRILMTDM